MRLKGGTKVKKRISLVIILVLMIGIIPQFAFGASSEADDAAQILNEIFNELTDDEQNYLSQAKTEIQNLVNEVPENAIWVNIFVNKLPLGNCWGGRGQFSDEDSAKAALKDFIADFTAIYFTTSTTLSGDIDNFVDDHRGTFDTIFGSGGEAFLYDLMDLMSNTFENIGDYVDTSDLSNLSNQSNTSDLMDVVADILKDITSDQANASSVKEKLVEISWNTEDVVDAMLLLLKEADDVSSDYPACQALANAIVRSNAERLTGDTTLKVGHTTSYTIGLFGKETNLVNFALEDDSLGTFSGSTLTADARGTTDVRVYRLGVDEVAEPLNYVFCFSITINPRTSGGGGGGGGTPPPDDTPDEPQEPEPVSVPQDKVTTTVTQEGDQKVATVTVDKATVQKTITDSPQGSTIQITTDGDADVVRTGLSGDVIQEMEDKDMNLSVDTGKATYTIPASDLDIDSLMDQLGDDVDSEDVTLSVVIADPPADAIKAIEDKAVEGGMMIVVPPVEFDVVCTSGDKSVTVSNFNSYVERTIQVPEGVDPATITTAVVEDAEGNLTPVPTEVYEVDGVYYVRIKSLTNSIYTVIYNNKEFADVANHWAKNDVNAMGSRLIITGMTRTTFEPDRSITRAEFMTILVRAMGIMRSGTGVDAFSDVTASDWYYDAVSIAKAYALTTGNGDGTFAPNSSITREEAMTMVARAMKIAGMDTTISASEMNTQLAAFSDSGIISSWAKASAASCIKHEIIGGYDGKISPKDNITRAECAAVVKRMLEKAGLI